MSKWEKVLFRGANFKMTVSTKGCSNHFPIGYCSCECKIPTLFLKVYDVPCSSKRASPRMRLSETQSFLKFKISRQVYRTGLGSSDNKIECSVTPTAARSMIMKLTKKVVVQNQCYQSHAKKARIPKNTTIFELKQELAEKKNNLKHAMKKIEELQNENKIKNRFFIEEVKDSKRLI